MISALLIMLLSLVPFMAPPLVAPGLARAQVAQTPGAAGAVVTIRDAETESLLRGIAHPLSRAAGLMRITLIQARPINAFVTTGNRMFIHAGLIQQAAGIAGRPRQRPGSRWAGSPLQ